MIMVILTLSALKEFELSMESLTVFSISNLKMQLVVDGAKCLQHHLPFNSL